MTSLTVQQERSHILEEMARIDRMIRGHVSQQTYQKQRGAEIITQGQYFLLKSRVNGKNNCIQDEDEELDAITAGVEAYARFQELTQRFALLTEQMTWNEQSAGV